MALEITYEIPSEPTLRMRLESIGQMMNEEILSDNISLLKACHVQPTALTNGMISLDIYVTPFDNSKSHKEGISRTYKVVHIFIEEIVQPVRLFMRTPQRFKMLRRRITNSLALCIFYTSLIPLQVLYIEIYRKCILRRIEYTAYHGFAYSHFRNNIAVKKLVHHIAAVVKITYCRCRNAQHGHIKRRTKRLATPLPHISATSR